MKYDFSSTERRQSKRKNSSFSFRTLSIPFNPKLFTSALFFTIGFLLLGLAMLHILTLHSTWDKKTPIGFVVFSKKDASDIRRDVHIVWVDPLKKTLKIIPFPSTVAVTFSRYGTYPLSSVKGLLFQEGYSPKDVVRIISLATSIDIFGSYEITSDKDASESVKDAVRGSLFGQAQTTLGISDRLALAQFVLLTKLKENQEQLPQSALKVTTKAGEEVAFIEEPVYRAWIDKRIFPLQIASEHVSVAVVNASEKRGIGTRVSQLLERMGFNILSIGDKPEKVQTGVIYVRDQATKKLYSTQQLMRLLAIPVEVNAAESDRKRTDIVVVLGERDSELIPLAPPALP